MLTLWETHNLSRLHSPYLQKGNENRTSLVKLWELNEMIQIKPRAWYLESAHCILAVIVIPNASSSFYHHSPLSFPLHWPCREVQRCSPILGVLLPLDMQVSRGRTLLLVSFWPRMLAFKDLYLWPSLTNKSWNKSHLPLRMWSILFNYLQFT